MCMKKKVKKSLRSHCGLVNFYLVISQGFLNDAIP